jgi:two-component system sensor histidine kinase UhpB
MHDAFIGTMTTSTVLAAPLWFAPGPPLPTRDEFDAPGNWTAIQEAERQRIAQEIHDDLGGLLTGLKACIEVAMERAARAGLPPEPLLDDALALARAGFDAVRRIATNLHPAVLDQHGVWKALAWHIGALARRSGICCDYLVDGRLSTIELGRDRELAIFRIVQEALTNVERHAGASKLSVHAACTAQVLSVTVADDGIGIGQSRQSRQRTGASLGIASMKQRAQCLNGTLTASSHDGAGTVLRLTLPLGHVDGG